MDSSIITDGGDGDNAAKEANGSVNLNLTISDEDDLHELSDVERMYEENAKRCKMAEESSDLEQLYTLENNSQPSPNSGNRNNELTGSSYETSTILYDTSSTEYDLQSKLSSVTEQETTSPSKEASKEETALPQSQNAPTSSTSDDMLGSDEDPILASLSAHNDDVSAAASIGSFLLRTHTISDVSIDEILPCTSALNDEDRESIIAAIRSDLLRATHITDVSNDEDIFPDDEPILPSPSTLNDEDVSINASIRSDLGRVGSLSDITDEDDNFPDSPLTLRLSEADFDDDVKPAVLLKEKPKHNWFIMPEIINRQFGTRFNCQSSIQFQQRCYGSLHCVERLELMYKLDKHTGCVNSINFHPNGSLLASGSDDLEIVLWDWKVGNPLLSFPSKHKSNVFQSKFMPLTGSDLHIVTCARDGQVRLAQVSAQEGLRSSRKLGSHRGPSHKLTVLQDQPQVVISVGEDGLVLKHDLRSSKPEQIITVHRDDSDVVALYSVSSNPLNTNEYCVTGRDYRVRTFDIRKGDKELALYHPFDTVSDMQKHLHVTCAVYNHNGSEILASYNDEDIYLFDAKGKEGTYVHCYQGHRNEATIKGVNFFGPKSEFVISGSDCGFVYFWERETEAIVQFLRADDNGVVNCLEPHPQLPFLCTSGLDRDIKVWVPSFEEDPKMTHLLETLKMNLKERSHWSTASSTDVENARILWMLWRQFNTTELLRRIATDGRSNHSSSSDTNSISSSSSSVFTTTASENESDEGPDGCTPS